MRSRGAVLVNSLHVDIDDDGDDATFSSRGITPTSSPPRNTDHRPRPQPPQPSTPLPRVILYHQTIFSHGEKEYTSPLPLITHTAPNPPTHLIIAAIHLNPRPGDITLNNHPIWHPRFDTLWSETHVLQDRGIKVMGMLGGASKGSYTRLDCDDMDGFEMYYRPLERVVRDTGLQGLDLDVEEHMSLAGIIRLITRLRVDFGKEFIITLTPVAAAMMDRERGADPKRNLSGFSYFDLEKALGTWGVDWYNVQFYCGWGNAGKTDDYDRIVKSEKDGGGGWDSSRIVLGVVTNPRNCRGFVPDAKLEEVLGELSFKYEAFGGVFGWEYFNAAIIREEKFEVGRPWEWVIAIAKAARSKQMKKPEKEDDEGSRS